MIDQATHLKLQMADAVRQAVHFQEQADKANRRADELQSLIYELERPETRAETGRAAYAKARTP